MVEIDTNFNLLGRLELVNFDREFNPWLEVKDAVRTTQNLYHLDNRSSGKHVPGEDLRATNSRGWRDYELIHLPGVVRVKRYPVEFRFLGRDKLLANERGKLWKVADVFKIHDVATRYGSDHNDDEIPVWPRR